MLRNRVADPVCRDESWIGVDVCVSLRGLWLAVAEQLANKRQRYSRTNPDAGRRMPEIVEAHLTEVGRRAQPAPGLCQVDERLAVMPPLDDVITGNAIRAIVQSAEHAKGSIAQVYRLCAGFAVGEVDHAAIPVNPLPPCR